MTRRIGLVILLTVWATLVVSGLLAYLTTRAVLLADLDASLMERAAMLPELARGENAAAGANGADRYLVRDELGKTINLPYRPASSALPMTLVKSWSSTLADGHRVRTVTLRISTSSRRPAMTVVYSGSADGLAHLLNQLALTLALFGAGSGVLAAVFAYIVARTALQPLRETAEALRDIDEHHLAKRVEEGALPAELAPFASRLNELLARLQKAFAERRRFLADASHELRTPVAALVTTLEVALRRPRDGEELKRTLETSLSEARALAQLVKSLLQQVRGDAPDDSEGPEVFDVARLLDQCADIADGLGSRRKIRVTRDYPPRLDACCDRSRLRVVTMNLLANAVEHNPDGNTVHIHCRHSDEKLHLSVRDNGQGIAPEQLANLFQPFYRADSTRRADDDHLGLGLFLVQSHVGKMQGSCRIESEVGKGTAVHVEIPVPAVPPTPQAFDPSANPMSTADEAGANEAAISRPR